MSLVYEVERLTRTFACKGGKTNRRLQRKRMIEFAKHAQTLGEKSMQQVGKRHVIGYWRERRSMAKPTIYNHWLALCILWGLTGKNGQPPLPRQMEPKQLVVQLPTSKGGVAELKSRDS